MRRTADLLRLVYIFSTGVALIVDRPLAFHLIGVSLVAILVRDRATPGWELAFVSALSLEAVGNTIHLFGHYYGYDKLAHFFITLTIAGLLYVFLGESPPRRSGIILTAAALGLALGAGFEIWEWLVNNASGHQVLGTSYGDTIGDLAVDLAGSLTAGVLLSRSDG